MTKFKDTETKKVEEPRGKGQSRQREKHSHGHGSMTEQETVKELPCNYIIHCSKLVTRSLDTFTQTFTKTPKLSSSLSVWGSHVSSHVHPLWAASHPVSVFYRTNPSALYMLGSFFLLDYELPESTDHCPWGAVRTECRRLVSEWELR